MPSLVAIVKKPNEILRIVQSVALGVCYIYILQSIYVHLLTFLINLSVKCTILEEIVWIKV